MSEPKIGPALTEWRTLRRNFNRPTVEQPFRVEVGDANVLGPHAVAALALHGQPFGFTRYDVAILRDAAFLRAEYSDAKGAEIDSLADRIEALLPPEGA